MEIRATTGAKWYGAPAPYFCAPRSKLPAAPQWNYGAGWCDPSKPLNTTFDSVDSYLSYVKVRGGWAKMCAWVGAKVHGWGLVETGISPLPAAKASTSSIQSVQPSI